MAKLSSEEAALLRAISRAKADDLPRLIYADWLDERGRAERAEFIRLQIDEARTPLSGIPGTVQRQRIANLEAAHAAEWLKVLPKWTRLAYDREERPEFVRGFASEWSLHAASFCHYGPQLLDRTPVETVLLSKAKNIVDEIVRCVWLREVPTVHLRGNEFTDADAVELAEAEWLVGVRVLHLCNNAFTDVGVRALANSRHLAGIHTLCLNDNGMTLAGVRALADSPYLEKAHRIFVHYNPHLEYRDGEVRYLLGTRFTPLG